MRFLHLSLVATILSNSIAICSVQAQSMTLQSVLFLPPVTDSSDDTAVSDLYNEIQQNLRLSGGRVLIDMDEVQRVIGDRNVSEIVESPNKMLEFTTNTDTDFLISWRLLESVNGQITVSILIFSRAEAGGLGNGILSTLTEAYPNITQAHAAAATLAREISRPVHFSSGDTALLLSMIMPGLGQLQKGESVHALVSFGLFAGAVFNALSIRKPDDFVFSATSYDPTWDTGLEDYRWYIRNQEVSKSEFFTTMNEDWVHHIRARGERGRVEVQKKRAVAFIAGTYLINLIDTLWLSRKQLDTRPFFLSVQPIQTTTRRTLSLAVNIHFLLSRR
ncbi:hypothetical protein ACFL39_01155 [Gemmatimonadota bacterium]